VDTQLEAVAEEDEEDEDPRIIDPVAAAHEVLFHEVKTRPDDRFGRAMVGVGGTGYDPRAVRRVLESAIGTTDSLPDQRPASVDAARALKRGHSAPNVETGTLSPPRLATPNVSNNR
jgi:D-tyrosyl-tRNA(Tyr) deacylase